MSTLCRIGISNMKLNSRGYSLVEIMVCIGIMAVVLFGGTSTMVSALQQTTDDRYRWNGLEIGSLWMETLTNSFASNGMLNPGTQNVYFNEDYTQGSSSSYFYNVQWTVTANTPVIGVNDIVVTVNWSENATPRFLVLETYR
jgi:prepilin-type N-terminal cleavage/methylation domain-containing protein